MYYPRYFALLASLALAGCADLGSGNDDITDVAHTDVERQSIGNCWLYAQASWIESLHLTATGDAFDVSQSYWTYWHWYGEITGHMSGDEISTGGGQWESNSIARERGIVSELDFLPEDATGEMSDAQKNALDRMNEELKSGRLKTADARRDGKLVRDVLDEAWSLSDGTVAWLDDVFGEDGATTLEDSAERAEGSPVVAAQRFEVAYTVLSGDVAEPKTTVLDEAIAEWQTADYPWDGSDERRSYLIRVQRALHDRQPVVITWDVDFNALENRDNEYQGSFNLETLEYNGGAGKQGGHMTVLEDYQADTEEYGLLKAGETLDPGDPRLAAALLPSTEVVFFRIKNSWGTLRPDREFAPDFPGYHDLYMDYLNGPITWCPDVEGEKTAENCTGSSVPLNSVMLPPGY